MFPSISAIEQIQDHFIDSERNTVVDDYSFEQVKQSLQFKSSWNELVVSALEVAANVNPYLPDMPEGSVIRAIDAMDWSGRNCDIRPRLVDKSSGTSRLVDSGSQISVAKKGPNDKIDHSIKLVAVNGKP